MAKNDVVLLDGIIEQRILDRVPSDDVGDVFEFFVLEQVLKDYDLGPEDIDVGWTDGRDDGGIDGFYIFINGHLLDDVSDFMWPKSNASIEVWLFTCKHHSTFVQSALDAILASINELFDLSIGASELCGSYSEDILRARELFHSAYRKLSIGRPVTMFHVVYGSRGDTKEIGSSVTARSEQIVSSISALFSSCTVAFSFIGATELVELHRKTRTFCLDLPIVDRLETGNGSYVVLASLYEYWKFVTDESGNLRRYLFDSNVRDYLGSNPVNNDIAQSLSDVSAPDFWWLNNGVTILATNAAVPGKYIHLQDIQIVNGLQTTETIYKHFSSGSTISSDRCVLLKIIVSSDVYARDQIIRATNNQSLVEVAALHATDKIQRDIEEILERNDWYYERRKNYYRNTGKPQNRIVTPSYVASAVVALVFKNPTKATKMKSKYMRDQESYSAIFSDKLPVNVWPSLVGIYKAVERGMGSESAKPHWSERQINAWRALVALILVAKLLKTYSFSVTQLAQFDLERITQTDIDEVCRLVFENCKRQLAKMRPPADIVLLCCSVAKDRFGINGLEEVGRRTIPNAPPTWPQAPTNKMLPPDFVNQVDSFLPIQPWKPGVHVEVSRQMECKPNLVQDAIRQLIFEGRRNQQIDGIVFNPDGSVLAIDEGRVRKTISKD